MRDDHPNLLKSMGINPRTSDLHLDFIKLIVSTLEDSLNFKFFIHCFLSLSEYCSSILNKSEYLEDVLVIENILLLVASSSFYNSFYFRNLSSPFFRFVSILCANSC